MDEITLKVALEESLRLQNHYAQLLNMHDGGKRITFENVEKWLERLRKTGTLPLILNAVVDEGTK